MNGHYAPSYEVDGGTTGMMILSRFPLSEPTAIQIENSRDIGAAATLSIQNTPVRVLSVHLSATYRISAEHYEESREARGREATRIMQFIEKRRGPVIIAGDLNTTQGSKPYETFSSALTDCAAKLSPHPAATYPAALPTLRLDHVFVSSHFVPVKAATRKGGSDHLLLIVDLRLKD